MENEWLLKAGSDRVNPITYGVEAFWVFLARTIRLLIITLKRLNLARPNLVTLTFYLLVTVWQNFNKISSSGGVAAAVFEMTRLEKLNL